MSSPSVESAVVKDPKGIVPLLRCPETGEEVEVSEDRVVSKGSGRRYRRAEGRYYFKEVDARRDVTDSLDRVKYFFKRFPGLYRLLVDVCSPVMTNGMPRRLARDCEGVVVNLGSGSTSLTPEVINVDLFDYPTVDVVADITRLPFRDASVDLVVNLVVLEHVREPAAVVREIHRILKPGGAVYSVAPFIAPFHASPDDFTRWTREGLTLLHGDFEPLRTGAYSGPVSGFLWVFQEFVGMLLSFGVPALRDLFATLVMLLIWPLKALDLLFRRLPVADNISATFYFHGRKR